MANEFTPGPWTVSERGDLFRIREEASDAVIATTDNGGHPVEEIFDYDTQRANARLIAAAPELFEALDWIAPLLNRVWNTGEPITQADLTPGRSFTLNRALAKARGDRVSA